jgi:hypothetical protein
MLVNVPEVEAETGIDTAVFKIIQSLLESQHQFDLF